MIRTIGLTLTMSALVVAFIAAADDPPAKGAKEPAKKQPVDLPPAKDQPGAKDAKDAKDAKPDEQPAARRKSPEDPKEIIVSRLKENLEAATELEEKKDPGETTRDTQKKIIDDLEKLIKQESDKNSNSSSSSNSNSSDSKSSPKDASSSKPSSGSGKPSPGSGKPSPSGNKGNSGEKKEDTDKGLTKKPMGDPKGGKGDKKEDKGDKEGDPKKDQDAKLKDGEKDKKGNGNKPGAGDPEAKKNSIPEKNEAGNWGHLPEHRRRQMDVFAKERFMPSRVRRPPEAILQWTIAEQNRKKEGE